MASATSSPAPNVIAAPLTIAALRAALPAAPDAVPLLVIRLPELERTAWRSGLRKARLLERRAGKAFAAAAARALRAGDAIAHDTATDIYVAALLAPNRDGMRGRAVDVRSALARIVATLDGCLRIDVESGWTMCSAGDAGNFGAVVGQALQRGAQERERYAFFSALGHELRTPLASIRGYLETLDDDTLDDATRRRFVGIAHNETLRLSRLIEGMFEISLLDLQPAHAKLANASLASALDAALDACAAKAASRGVRLASAPDRAPMVAIDGDRLTLVLINLIDNAIKHGRAGGTVRIAVEPDVSSVAVMIDDDGTGVPPAQYERIFAFGERGDTHASGSGIGLALVRLMLERSGGRIAIARSPLGGARFCVTLPRATDATTALA